MQDVSKICILRHGEFVVLLFCCSVVLYSSLQIMKACANSGIKEVVGLWCLLMRVRRVLCG